MAEILYVYILLIADYDGGVTFCISSNFRFSKFGKMTGLQYLFLNVVVISDQRLLKASFFPRKIPVLVIIVFSFYFANPLSLFFSKTVSWNAMNFGMGVGTILTIVNFDKKFGLWCFAFWWSLKTGIFPRSISQSLLVRT